MDPMIEEELTRYIVGAVGTGIFWVARRVSLATKSFLAANDKLLKDLDAAHTKIRQIEERLKSVEIDIEEEIRN